MQTVESQIKIRTVEASRLPSVDMNDLPFGRVFSDHMLMAKYDQGQWGDPEIVPFGKLSLAPSVCSLHYGQSIFEGMKAFKSDAGDALLFRPQENHKRMNRSAERMCMPGIPDEIFLEGLKTLISLDKGWIPPHEKGSLYIRPLLFATDEYVGIRPSDSYYFLIFSCPVGSYYHKPVSLYVSRDYVRAAPGGTGAAKCAGNYAGALFPDKVAKSMGYDNVLWLDAKTNSYVEECGTMNVFFVIDGKVITSPLTGSILPGINRDSVIKLLRHRGIPVEERPLSIYEVESASEQGILDEAFGAGTAATIASIDRIGFGGKDLHLPDTGGAQISRWLRDTLHRIKIGAEAAPFEDWVWTVA